MLDNLMLFMLYIGQSQLHKAKAEKGRVTVVYCGQRMGGWWKAHTSIRCEEKPGVARRNR